ncbi:peroxiredoxin [Roseococcus sp. SYP-B2431]|uniref:peroxiredoxin n=1 Tax=Roseococcus sp. SYP-B2431 TaxID=2496640 RepID=UPI00103F8913|nr:peroxiredoxin [Roseococcus sp. SYP-B2431]TCH97727.1 peroxiredoxin [Roseococcus sp. SYP-B2431]
MPLTLGQTAPDFEAETTAGPIRFSDWARESWVVFFSHPKDFTPVCTTELGEAARLKPEFDRRGVKVIGLSVDALDRHGAWAEDIEATQGHALNFPMIADPSKHVSQLYGMIHPEADPSITVRTVYVIDPARKVRLTLTYPPSTGRNFDEVLRVIDSLQLTDKHKVATPVNWQKGDKAIIVPSLSDEDAAKRFPQGWQADRPYLRWVEVAE